MRLLSQHFLEYNQRAKEAEVHKRLKRLKGLKGLKRLKGDASTCSHSAMGDSSATRVERKGEFNLRRCGVAREIHFGGFKTLEYQRG